MSAKPIRVVELFAGVGGFRLAFENTSKRFKTIWANQWEPNRKVQHAFNCYNANFGESKNHVNEDISKVLNDIPEHDLLVGGFPCQDYSVARTKATGIEGKKGVLWWSIAKIVKEKQPKFVLLENVDRLVKSPSSQRGRDFGIMLRSLYESGYDVEWRVINAADFGFVQRRRRVFIFATKSNETEITDLSKYITEEGFFAKDFKIIDVNLKKTMSSNIAKYEDLVDVSNNFQAQFYNAGIMKKGLIYSLEVNPKKAVEKPIKDILVHNGVDSKYLVNGSYDKFVYLKGNKRIERFKPNGEKYMYSEGAMTFPDSLDKPARTMLTSESSVNRSTHVIIDPATKQPRLITPVEAERINGFKDNWTNTGMPEKMRYFCMGNALVVPLVEIMAKRLLKMNK